MTTTIIPARERAQAPIGLPYIAPLFCGRTQDEHHTGLQVFADGEWHPVVGWALDDCTPASDYFQEEDA